MQSQCYKGDLQQFPWWILENCDFFPFFPVSSAFQIYLIVTRTSVSRERNVFSYFTKTKGMKMCVHVCTHEPLLADSLKECNSSWCRKIICVFSLFVWNLGRSYKSGDIFPAFNGDCGWLADVLSWDCEANKKFTINYEMKLWDVIIMYVTYICFVIICDLPASELTINPILNYKIGFKLFPSNIFLLCWLCFYEGWCCLGLWPIGSGFYIR